MDNRKANEQKIVDFLGNDSKTLRLESSCPSELIDILDAHGWVAVEDSFDTNGWQYDWWQQVVSFGKTMTLSGSGYYGGAEITKDE